MIENYQPSWKAPIPFTFHALSWNINLGIHYVIWEQILTLCRCVFRKLGLGKLSQLMSYLHNASNKMHRDEFDNDMEETLFDAHMHDEISILSNFRGYNSHFNF